MVARLAKQVLFALEPSFFEVCIASGISVREHFFQSFDLIGRFIERIGFNEPARFYFDGDMEMNFSSEIDFGLTSIASRVGHELS